jgi:hypothetical protein
LVGSELLIPMRKFTNARYYMKNRSTYYPDYHFSFEQ